MNRRDLEQLLNKLRALPAETEWVEFKEASRDYDFNKIGKYFSALSNEANMKNKPWSWLIFGVEDKTRKIVGSQYRTNRAHLDSLKNEIGNKTNNRITFIEIHELDTADGRVVFFQIPAAPQGIPTSWEGHFYGRDGESIGPLNIQEIEQIRNQVKPDWSAQICEAATLNDLDPESIQKARKEYKNKYPNRADEVDAWDDLTFLNKAKVTLQNKITYAAIILLGKEEADHFIQPSIAKMSWILKNDDNIEIDYEHFGPPFLLQTDAILAKIRNLKYRYLPDRTLFPIEINKYEPYVIREALHNCIAHQDYELRGRINVVEKPDELIITNVGSFIPRTIEAVIEQDAPQKYYRNQFLANAMVNLNMIDTIGGGIRKMFLMQRNRFFPLPTYQLEHPEEVTVKITGKVLDENYTNLLINNSTLDLKTVIILDKVQKKEQLSKDEFKFVKDKKLVEGRYPNVYVASQVAEITDDKATYIKNRAFDDDYYKKMIIAFIKKYNSANRQDIDQLLMDKLSDALNETQKKNKIKNLLSDMSKNDNSIKNMGSDKKSKWVLV
jgi:Predicted transcriptional regulator containing an HTH domain and an uncharacterized domain shared with the mammalian protein Schlafen